jgi:hypothetical protein
MIKLLDITKEVLNEDRCKRIADRKYDKPSAYKSGAIVRCRKGNIWKKLKESDYFTGSKFEDDEGNKFSVEKIYNFVKKNKKKYYKEKYPLEKIKHNLKWWDKNYDIKNPKHKERMMNADISYPLLVVIEKNGNYSVADGLNRLYKAIKIEGKKELPVYIIDKSEIEKFEEDSNETITDLTVDELKDIIKDIISAEMNNSGSDKLNEAKKETLRTWFKRKGAPGKTGGWVDCNTCREVDGKKKCKPCGRKKGETRAKYPSCRPTPSQCGDPGKGKKWGKTK